MILSYKCSAKCYHCLFACSPQWPNDWMDSADLELLLSKLAPRIKPAPKGDNAVNINYGIHFTGGEPFLNTEKLLQSVSIAQQLKIPSVMVETNASWCIEDDSAKDCLIQLRNAGLKGILVSVNPYSIEHVPFERVERCVRISRSIFGNNLMIYQPEMYNIFRHMGLEKKISHKMRDKMISNPNFRANLLISGRAVLTLKTFYPAHPAEYFVDHPCQPAFLRKWHNHFDLYGNFIPGFCAGISLGKWTELEQLEQEGVNIHQYPILGFLLMGSMKKLFEFACQRGYEENPDGYISKCDLCLSLRRFLVNIEPYAELAPINFYQQL